MFSVIFPGQGSQIVGMGKELYNEYELVRNLFKETDDVLNAPLSKIILEGPQEELNITANTQPAIFLISYSIFQVIKQEYKIDLSKAKYFAGHSLGEYSALACAGYLDFKSTIKILKTRGDAMQNSVPRGEGGMLAILGSSIEIIENDKNVLFNKYKIKKIAKKICVLKPDGTTYEIEYSNKDKDLIPWLGKPELFLECSGKNTAKKDCIKFLKNKTKTVIISATSWDAEKTLIYGFNHQEFKKKIKIISYGSCTVNAFIPLGSFMENNFGIIDADVNVVHNIQEYRLKDNITLNRKFCTLEKSGPQLLKSINKKNFKVNYTVVPYTGVSMIDFRFRLKKCPSINKLINTLEKETKDGDLKGLYNGLLSIFIYLIILIINIYIFYI